MIKKTLFAFMAVFVMCSGVFAQLPKIDCSGANMKGIWGTPPYGSNDHIYYAVNDIVEHNGKMYQCVLSSNWNDNSEAVIGSNLKPLYWKEVECIPTVVIPTEEHFNVTEELGYNGTAYVNEDIITPLRETMAGISVSYKKENTTINVFEDLSGTPKDAGKYQVYVHVESETSAWKETGSPVLVGLLEIKPIELELTGIDEADFTFVYNAQDREQDFEDAVAGKFDADDNLIGVLNGEDAEVGNVDFSEIGVAKNVGKYTGKITTENPNYVIKNGGIIFTIVPKVINFHVSSEPDGGFVFNGNPQLPQVTIQAGIESGDNVTLEDINGETNAGAYEKTAVLTGDDAGNYELEISTFNFTINPKPITVEWTGNTSFTYNGSEQGPGAMAVQTTLVPGVSAPISVTGKQRNAGGPYTATATTSNANYVITENSTTTFTIAKKEVTVSWETLTFAFDGTTFTPKAKVDGNVYLDVSGGAYSVGKHTAIAKLKTADAVNYTITNQGDLTKEFEITQPATSILDGKGKRTYGIAFEANIVKGEAAKFTVSVPEAANVKLAIYDIMGNLINSQELRANSEGVAFGAWNMMNSADRYVAAGSYLVVVEAKGMSGKTYRYTAKLGVAK